MSQRYRRRCETRAKLSRTEALVAHLQLVIEKMKHETFGPRSECSQRLLDQMDCSLRSLPRRRVRISPELPITRTKNSLSSCLGAGKLTHSLPVAKAA